MWNPFRKKIDTFSETPQQKDYHHRLLLVKVIFIGLFLAAAARLIQIQVIEAGTFKDIARKQYEARVPLKAQRGIIYDRNDNVLVGNTLLTTFAADPTIAEDKAKFIAQEFSRVTGKPVQEYLEKLKTKRRFVYLERNMRPDIADRIPISTMPGVVKMNEATRLYHYDELAGQVLGATSIDNIGVSGIEEEYNDDLKGRDGYVVLQRDGLGRTRPSVDFPRENAVNGHSIELTLDLQYQSIAEEELKKGVARAEAEAALVVMLKPQTGEILAMANYPQVNLNRVDNVDALKNRVVSDMYEPGSIFKIVTASAALDENVVTLDKKIYAENGKYKVEYPGNRYRYIHDTHPMKNITFLESMAYSSNIVFAKVSDLIGPENLYTKARDFGFGMQTGIELPAESSGELKKTSEWSLASLNSIAFGYEVGVTPLQIVSAYGAIANDGVLMRPYIVKRELDENGVEVFANEPQMIRRVNSKEVNEKIKKMLEAVVEFGTGTSVQIPGVDIAGKTGTSRKYVDGKYETGSYNASFVGFFPAEKPEIVCLVILEKPKKGYYGAIASAPIFKGIAERIIHNNGLLSKSMMAENQHGDEEQDPKVTVPNVAGLEVDRAIEDLKNNGLAAKVIGNGLAIVRQYPQQRTAVDRGSIVQLMTNELHGDGSPAGTTVPDLHGMSIRRAVSTLAAEQYSVSIVGSGIVVNQFPNAGVALKKGSKITVMCEPKPITTAQLY